MGRGFLPDGGHGRDARGGKTGDLFGRRRLLLASIGLFTAGSAFSGASQSMLELILSRGLQGIGGGALFAAVLSVLADVAGPSERARYQGYLGSVFGLASILGPPFGGFFTDSLSWRWIFWLNVLLGVLIFVVVVVVLRIPGLPPGGVIDYLGIALLCGAVGCWVPVVSWAGSAYDWTSPLILGLAVTGVLFSFGLMLAERRAAEPLIPLSLFRVPAVGACCAVGFLTALALFGVITYLPLLLRIGLEADASTAGMLLLPFMAAVVASSTAAGRAIGDTNRYLAFPAIGTALATLAMVLVAALGMGVSILVTEFCLVLFGVGIGLVMQMIVLAVQESVPTASVGAATGVVLLGRSLGSLFGVAVFGAVFNWRLGSELDATGTSVRLAELGPDAIQSLPAAVHADVLEGFYGAFSTVLWMGVGSLALAFAAATVLRRTVPTLP